uniref:FLZ-type domain-containing protein n=1 Tax=Setaria italica TaxID=4555 RepID=K3YEL8_SETIT
MAAAAHLACAFFFDAEPLGEPGRHALDACALCSKPLSRNSDIFMYKGDTPFCSEDCRDEQMQFDAIRARQAPYSSGTESRRGHQESRKVSAVAS